MYPPRIPMAAALLPSALCCPLPTAQSSQPRMTDHRLSRRLIPLVRRCLALAQPRHRPSARALAWAPTSPWAMDATRCDAMGIDADAVR